MQDMVRVVEEVDALYGIVIDRQCVRDHGMAKPGGQTRDGF